MAKPAGKRQPEPLVAEVVEGLEDLAAAELIAAGAEVSGRTRAGLRFTHPAPLELGAQLRLVAAIYRELRFAAPRPRALLGDEALRRLAATVERTAGGGGMRSFRFAAAGADSAVFQRLAAALTGATGLRHDAEDGALLLRVRPYDAAGAAGRGWEVLVRLTERPLSTRAWRVCNRPGGVNATVAAAMNQLLRPRPEHAYLNLMCGSGTLLVERALAGPAARLVGVDLEAAAVECARSNLDAAGVAGCELLAADVASLTPNLFSPSPDAASLTANAHPALRGGFQELAADAPWGDAVGEHAANERLYPALLASAAGLASQGARFALLSHEVRLLERLLPGESAWQVESSRRLAHGGHRPALVLLRRV